MCVSVCMHVCACVHAYVCVCVHMLIPAHAENGQFTVITNYDVTRGESEALIRINFKVKSLTSTVRKAVSLSQFCTC